MTRTFILAAAALALAGCAAPGGADAPSASPAPQASPARIAQSFAAWRAEFRARALAAGIAPATFDRAFAGVSPNQRVMELDNHQPEFTRPIWEYLDSAVSATRVENGRAKLAAESATLREIEERYRVDRSIVLAIWGLESAYGVNYGSIPVIESLATLAFDGRRRNFAEEQLISALRILDAGDIAPAQMVGSWAGAMGHTQFMPTSFQAYAVDHDGNGRRDLWADDPADALASTANYLAKFGWRFREDWGVEVALPPGFDYALADQSIRRITTEWEAMGVRTARGDELPKYGEAAIILPAGAKGPAFAVFRNFDVIRRYNNSTSYALAVGHLADRIEGAPPLLAAWPRGDRPLSRSETQEMQRQLTGLGYDTQGVDGIIGPNSRAAIRAFQTAHRLTPDGYPSAALLSAIRSAGG